MYNNGGLTNKDFKDNSGKEGELGVKTEVLSYSNKDLTFFNNFSDDVTISQELGCCYDVSEYIGMIEEYAKTNGIDIISDRLKPISRVFFKQKRISNDHFLDEETFGSVFPNSLYNENSLYAKKLLYGEKEYRDVWKCAGSVLITGGILLFS